MEHRHDLRTRLSFAAQKAGVNYRRFRDARGIDSLLTDAMLEEWDAKELAVNALSRMIAGDKGSMDKAVVMAVVDYLDYQLGVPPESRLDTERLRALGDIVTSGQPNERAFRRWLESWYP